MGCSDLPQTQGSGFAWEMMLQLLECKPGRFVGDEGLTAGASWGRAWGRREERQNVKCVRQSKVEPRKGGIAVK